MVHCCTISARIYDRENMMANKTKKRSERMDRDGFRSGISAVSVGRFAGFREELPQRVTCQTYQAGDMAFWAHGQQIFYLMPPKEYSIRRSASWAGMETRIKYSRAGRQSIRLNASLLAPAMRLEFTEPFLDLRMPNGMQAEHIAFPTRRGVKIVNSLEYYIGEGLLYDRKQHGAITRPWFILWWGPRNPVPCAAPLLVVMEKHPQRIDTRATSGVIHAEYKGPAGSVTIMPLGGLRTFAEKDVGRWHEKGLPADVLASAEYWSKLLQVYPIACDERFKVEADKERVVIRNEFEYLENKCDWKVKKQFFSPISPILAHARKHGFPIKLSGRIVETDVPTGYGSYSYLRGTGFEYTLPSAGAYVGHVTAPVRVDNDHAYTAYKRGLSKYMKDPKWTYGGDFDYDPGTIMDALHNARVLGWASWALPEEERLARFKEITAPIKTLRPDYYHHEVEPLSGCEYWWDKQEFWEAGVIQFDFEWYTGMNLSGAWAYYHYGHGVSSRRDLAKAMPYMEKWLGYIETTHDWALLNPCVTIPGQNVNMDGAAHAVQGVMATARTARSLGRNTQAEYLVYLASRMLVPWYDCWFAPEYRRELDKLGVLTPKQRKREWTMLDFYGGDRPRAQDGRWCVPYGDLGLELMEFYRKYLPERVRRFEYGYRDKKIPGWGCQRIPRDTRTICGVAGEQGGVNRPNATHFYRVDPSFITRAIMLREPLKQTRKYTMPHTGQVLAAFMAGQHPLVHFPTAARFGGNVWDAKTRTLTITLLKEREDRVTVMVDSSPKPKRVEGAKKWSYAGGRATIEVTFGSAKRVVLALGF